MRSAPGSPSILLVSIPLALVLGALPQARQKSAAYAGRDDRTPGHSLRGHAFDQGPRQKPWKMEGIGKAHLAITTRVPEVQVWFDQGLALLHSFWFYEAERTFRWCIELDPECAMAYWGMALAVESDEERFESLLSEALRRKDAVSEHERLYIEAWVGANAPRLEGRFETKKESDSGPPERNELLERLEKLVLDYPDDVEAKAFCLLASLGQGGRIANEALFQELVAVAPEHPGAHHYRIHLWDDSEQGDVALESCAKYGRIAWDVGHANHMPGHVYSGLGMWREAGLWMESATRIELRQMQERGLFPYDYWNFAHNRNYLCYIQEQQGLVEQALLGARTLLASPTKPVQDEHEDDKGEEREDEVQFEGMTALVRCLLKFERWDEILRADAIPWKKTDEHAAWRAYAEALAHLGKGEVPEAIESATALQEGIEKLKDEWSKKGFQRGFREVDALIRLRTERELEGLSELEELAREQALDYRRRDDPPDDRALYYDLLGELHLERGSPKLAVECFTKALELVRNDGFALSGLARAEHVLGRRPEATLAFGRLRHVWARADAGLRWMEAARALGLQSEPIDESPAKQRDYDSQALVKLGPIAWEPFAAPELAAVDADGKAIGLEELRGQNVVLVFYLGGQCVHCVEELAALAKRAEDFAALDATILAVSADAPADLAKPAALKGLELRLLSDPEHANARAFHAWDDFKDQALHATLLIDRQGRERWAHVGATPFSDVERLLEELRRWGSASAVASVPGDSAGGD